LPYSLHRNYSCVTNIVPLSGAWGMGFYISDRLPLLIRLCIYSSTNCLLFSNLVYCV